MAGQVARIEEFRRRVPCYTCGGRREHLLGVQIMPVEKGQMPPLLPPRMVPTGGQPLLLRSEFICEGCFARFGLGEPDVYVMPATIKGKTFLLKQPESAPVSYNIDGWVEFKLNEIKKRVAILRRYTYDLLGHEYIRSMEQCKRDYEELAHYARWSRVEMPSYEELFGLGEQGL